MKLAKNILITGGCGFIGSNIVSRLLEEGHNVTVLDDLSSGKKENIKDSLTKPNCKFVKGSILEQDLLMNLLRDVEVVIHEAANPDVRTSTDNLFKDFKINVQGTLNILQAMVKNKVTKIIFSSSGGTVYGETNNLPTPENEPLAPISHYGASKAACEQYLSSFSSLYSIEAYS
ncbi:MAG: SDR family NAD(P)-dependent oxidoreductase, partial [Candidatus Heimdallarchaeota archaeon]